jgi:hypothetical protein
MIIQSCSILGTYTEYHVSDGWKKSDEHIYQWKHSFDDYIKINENISGTIGIMPNAKFIVNTCFVSDSVKIYPEDILDYWWFIGPPYLPIIPNLIEPFIYFIRNKTTNYYLMISLEQSGSIIEISNLKFLRNGKKIIPKEINEIKFTDERSQDMYVINSKWVGDSIYYCSLQSQKTYLIIFNFNKNTLKSFEIRYQDKSFINIRRKKIWYHEIIFAH